MRFLWIVFFHVFHFSIEGTAVIRHWGIENRPRNPSALEHKIYMIPSPLPLLRRLCCQVPEMEPCHSVSCIRMMSTAERINYPAHFGVAGMVLYQPLTAHHGSLLMESLMRCSARRCRSHADRAEIKGFAKSLLSKQAAKMNWLPKTAALSRAKPMINREGKQENLYWVSHFYCKEGFFRLTEVALTTIAGSSLPRHPVSEPLQRPIVFIEKRLKTGSAHPDGSCSLMADCV